MYGFPKERAAEIAINVVRKFLAENSRPENAYFVCFDVLGIGFQELDFLFLCVTPRLLCVTLRILACGRLGYCTDLPAAGRGPRRRHKGIMFEK